MAIDFARVRAWMFDEALPFWGGPGIDRARGGYIEHFDLSGRPAAVDFKRVRVTCRQIYVFSHAALLGWARGEDCARHGFAFLKRSWRGGAWPRTVTPDGAPKDATPDLYDLAFAVFALCWLHRLTKEEEPLALALATLDFIDARMRGPNGGFLHELPPSGPRLQNPHMHLLEACLVGMEASGHPRFAALADDIAALFRARFFDMQSRTLAEYFTEDWRRAAGDLGRRIEPGHQFEWAWILTQLKRLGGADLSAEARAMTAFAEQWGVDAATGLTRNVVRDDGAPIDTASRTWPNTERIKAWIAAAERGDAADARAPIAQSIDALFRYHLSGPAPGLWLDVVDAAGAPIADKIPTSTLYHVFLAFAEVLRAQPLLSR
ncbi:MAG: AGE family epimerase/isomerase [Hydrogenophilaceae bacterium]|nr:AGE family epimerase/isomerase [Hydrogenophilaceae bacterium]